MTFRAAKENYFNTDISILSNNRPNLQAAVDKGNVGSPQTGEMGRNIVKQFGR